MYRAAIKVSHFPFIKTMDDFEFDFQPSLNKAQILNFCTLEFLNKNENIIFFGTPGVGKTHLATALGIEAIKHKYSTYFINCHVLIQNLLKVNFENKLEEKLKLYSKYKVLIIDEIGYLPTNIQGANLFFQLIARRYEKNTTFLQLIKILENGAKSFKTM